MSHVRLPSMDILVEVCLSLLRASDVRGLGDGLLEVLHRRLGMESGCLRVLGSEGMWVCSSWGAFAESESSVRVSAVSEGQAVGELVINAAAGFASSEERELLADLGRLAGAGLARHAGGSAVGGSGFADLDRSLLGTSGAMERLRKSLSAAILRGGPVLLRGHGGTGKDLVARLLCRGWCGDGPFIAVGGLGLTERSLREAVSAASGGVLYVDGLEGLSRRAQSGLLGLLRGGAVSGGQVRVVSSSCVDVESLVERGQFEGSLYGELSGTCLFLPDLKDRRSDIMLLANHFIEAFNMRHNRQIRRLSTPAINLLVAYHWPGNVRELENCMEHAVMSAMGDTIHGYNLPATLQVGGDDFRSSSSGVAEDFRTKVAAYERELLIAALKRANGKLSGAAQELGISPRVMHYKIHLHGITPAWYRHED